MTSHEIHVMDCRLAMSMLIEPKSIHTVITSPPYFGLRDYGHDGQIGLEPTPEEFVAAIVDVFREVRRVLRDDGTVWLNLGDSYAGSGRGAWDIDDAEKKRRGIKEAYRPKKNPHNGRHTQQSIERGVGVDRLFGCKPKDLIGIPWRVAFALQADGWYLRQDIIWHKPNPMPESVRDRCTKAHEYIFLLSKSPRYYFDHEAIKEPSSQPGRAGKLEKTFSTSDPKSSLRADVGRSVMRTEHRNKRSVWTVTTKPFKGAHFATFPPDLIEPCILAGCPEGGTVLDPFGGAGTTGLVAKRNGRNSILCELNEGYAQIARDRIEAT